MSNFMACAQRVVVYTCITGGYDELLEPLAVDPEVDYVCVSENPAPANSVWRHMRLPRDTGNDAVNSRYVKMHPHILFPDHDISIYVDGNIHIVSSVESFALAAMKHASVALYQHSFRKCVYEEAEECAILGYDWRWRISGQMQRYRREGFPFGWGLFECNVIIRNTHDLELVRLMNMWWDEYCGYVKRDQLSLTYLSWKNSIPIHNLGLSDPRGAKNTFALQKTHIKSYPLVRLRRAVNRRLLALGFYKIPTDDESGLG
jgi:hypothetical protein